MQVNNLPVGLKPDSLETHKTVVSNQEQSTGVDTKFKLADNQIPPRPVQETAKTSPSRPKIFTKILIVLLGFILLSFGGALGYYYFAVYDQERFAGEVLSFFQSMEKEGQVLNKSDLKTVDDYKGAVEILNARKDFLQKKKGELSKIRPPLFGPYKSLASDLNSAFAIFIEVNDEASAKASFMMEMVELKDLFEPKGYPFSSGTPSVEEVQDFFGTQIPKAQSRGDELFSKNPPRLSEISFDELKDSWGKARPALGKLLTYIQSFDPNAPLDPAKLNQPPTPELKGAVEEVNSFGRLIDAALNSNSAFDVVTYGSSQGVQEKLGERAQDIEKKLDELKKKYEKTQN